MSRVITDAQAKLPRVTLWRCWSPGFGRRSIAARRTFLRGEAGLIQLDDETGVRVVGLTFASVGHALRSGDYFRTEAAALRASLRDHRREMRKRERRDAKIEARILRELARSIARKGRRP